MLLDLKYKFCKNYAIETDINEMDIDFLFMVLESKDSIKIRWTYLFGELFEFYQLHWFLFQGINLC